MTQEEKETGYRTLTVVSPSPRPPPPPLCFQDDSTALTSQLSLIPPPTLCTPNTPPRRILPPKAHTSSTPPPLASSPPFPTPSPLHTHSPCGSVGYYSEIWSGVDSRLHEISMSIDLIWCGWLLGESLQSRAVAHLFIYLWQLCFTGFDLLFWRATAKDYKYTCMGVCFESWSLPAHHSSFEADKFFFFFSPSTNSCCEVWDIEHRYMSIKHQDNPQRDAAR